MAEVRDRVRALGWTTGSSVIVGALGLVAMVVAARGLGASAYAVFAVAWGVFFGVGGAFAGLQQEVTRSTTGREQGRGLDRRVSVSAIIASPVVLVGGVATLASLDSYAAASSLVIGAGLVGLGLLTYVSGILAALGRWRELALLLVADAGIRTCAVAVAVTLSGVSAVAVAVVSGAVLWPVLLGLPAFRDVLSQRGSDGLSAFAGRTAVAMLAAGCASVVVAGLPALVATLHPGRLGTEAGVAIAAMTLIRSSFLLLVYGYRPIFLRYFVSASDRRLASFRGWGLCLAVGLIYVVVVGALAPSLLPLVLGASFTIGAGTSVAYAAGTVGIAMVVLSGLALIAHDEHLWSAGGWAAALLLAVVCVMSAPTPAAAVVVAASVSPWGGVVVHGLALGAVRLERASARPGQSSPSENADSRSWRE